MGARPLPWCEGPKLEPFDIQGPSQTIVFKAHLASAVHSHVFEVSITGATYALKAVSILMNLVYKILLDSSLSSSNFSIPASTGRMQATNWQKWIQKFCFTIKTRFTANVALLAD